MAYAKLKAYVEKKNQWRAIFGDAVIQWPLSQSAVDELAESIDCELSPENLTCDGELSRAQVRARYRELTGAFNDLKEYADQYSMTLPQTYEAY